MRKLPTSRFVLFCLFFVIPFVGQAETLKDKASASDLKSRLSKIDTNKTDTSKADPTAKTETTKADSSKTSSIKMAASPQLASTDSSSSSGAAPVNVQVSSVHVEPFMGSANLSFPIQVPPGRGGIQPSIALNYSSSSRGLGLAGVGWSLDLGSIQRSTKKGVPTYDDAKDIFMMSQGGDLVADSNNPGMYHPEVEGGFAKIQKFSDHWEMTDRKGTKYYFGNTDDSRQYDSVNASHIFRWALNRVEDLNGNYMTISYTKDQGQIYPSTINYTGNSQQNLNPYATVSINYTAASNSSSSYISGFGIITAKRIDRISVAVGSNVQSTYMFSYKQSADTNRDLLQTVQQIGADGSSTLPPVTFNYNEPHLTWAVDSAWNSGGYALTDTQYGRHRDLGMRIADLNADAYPDLIMNYADCGENFTKVSYIHNKRKSWTASSNWQFYGGPAGDGADDVAFVRSCPEIDRDYGGMRLVDVDGDGYPDVVRNYFSGSHYKIAQINNRTNGFIKDDGWEVPDDAMFSYQAGNSNYDYTQPLGTLIEDINGDGYVDIVIGRTSWDIDHNIYLNKKGVDINAKGWAKASWSVPSKVNFTSGGVLADLNGDGLPDIMTQASAIYMNNGNGWVLDVNSPWLQNLPSALDFTSGNSVLVDINGDGLPDLIIGTSAYINTGHGWGRSVNLPSNVNFSDLTTQIMDVDADGLMDIVYSIDSDFQVSINQNKYPADILVGVNNGIGASSSIVYDSATHYQNTYLPFPIEVVKSVTTTVENPIGNQSVYTTNYDYTGGLWNTTYREFEGFKTVKVIDADGNYSITTFSQDHWLKGHPIEQASYDKDGHLYAKTTNQWQTQDIVSNAAFISSIINLNNKVIYKDGDHLDTTDKESGVSSYKSNGTTDYLEVPISDDWTFGSDDFTIDGWFKTKDLRGKIPQEILLQYSGGGESQLGASFSYENKLQFTVKIGNEIKAQYVALKASITDNNWHHIAFVRHGSSFYIFVDGVSQALSVDVPIENLVIPKFTKAITIGGDPSPAFNWNGNIDEFRVSKSIARWVSNFTPTTQNSCDSYTKLFLHFDGTSEANSCVLNQTSKFVYLARSDNYLYDGSSTAKRTAQEFTYGENPQYGNPTQVINYGEVDPVSGADVGVDKITTRSEYVNNTDQWLLGLPRAVTSKDINEKVVSKAWFYYDNATDNAVVPRLGRLTKKANWLGVGQVTASATPQSTDPQTRYSYDAYGNLKTTTDPLNNTTTIIYDNDVHMFPVKTINALNQIVKTSYYGVDGIALDDGNGLHGLWGQSKSTTDANNQSAYSAYDALGRPVISVGPLDTVTLPTSQMIYEYNPSYTKITAKARVNSGKDQTIDSASYYDGLGRLIENKSFGPMANLYIVSGQSEYNNRGLPVKKYLPRFTSNNLNTLDAIDTNQPVSQTQYDAMGRAIKNINADGTYANVVYDHWTTTSVDANGHMQKSYTDAFGRLIQKEEYAGADGRAGDYPAVAYRLYATTSYGYDVLGNLTSVMDAKGNVTAIKYDNLGRKIGMDDPDMGHWEYSYDANGNLKKQKDAKNQELSFYYDPLNRLVFKGQVFMTSTLPGPDAANNPPTPYMATLRYANYTYDDRNQLYGQGRLGAVGYGAGNEKATFIYDQLGRETASAKIIDQKNYKVNRQYDDLNRLTQLQYPDGAKVKYLYNQAGQVNTVLDADDATKVYVKAVNYNALGQMTQIEYGNGVTTGYSYDSLNRQLKRVYSSNTQGQSLQDLNYSYDALGQITKIEDKVNTSSQSFKYDELNRLTYAQGSGYGVKNYLYDEIGNITQKDNLNYHYAEANTRLDADGRSIGAAGPHAVTSLSDGTVFKYDANGNMVNIIKGAEKTIYIYDEQNRLTQVNSQTLGKPTVTVAIYSYDGDGGRTKKVVYRRDKAVYNSKNTLAFMYKDYNGQPWPGTVSKPKKIITRYIGQVYEEEDPATDGNPRKTKFIYLGSTRVAAINASAQGEIVTYFHNDHLGGTNVTSDQAGLAKELTEYDPYGLVIKHETYGNPTAAVWQYFTGKTLDDETGLMYYGARYYNPTLGRFITPDTIVQSPGNPQTLNRYTYCNNNPVNLVDPSGHFWFIFAAIAAVVKAAVTYAVAHPIITAAAINLVSTGINAARGNIPNFGAGLTQFGIGFASSLVALPIGIGVGTAVGNAAGSVIGQTAGQYVGAAAGVASGTVAATAVSSIGGTLAEGGSFGDGFSRMFRALPQNILSSMEFAIATAGIIKASNFVLQARAAELAAGKVITVGERSSQGDLTSDLRGDVAKQAIGYESKTLHFEQSGNPLEGAKYHDRVFQRLPGNAIKADFHSFPLEAENYAVDATVEKIIYSDGSYRIKVSVQGAYRVGNKGQIYNGNFVWIKTQDNQIIHRRFEAD